MCTKIETYSYLFLEVIFMVRLANQMYCYNEQCLHQWCDRCACCSITIDADGRCASCVPIRLSSEELKAYKRKHCGIDLVEDATYQVIHRDPEE